MIKLYLANIKPICHPWKYRHSNKIYGVSNCLQNIKIMLNSEYLTTYTEFNFRVRQRTTLISTAYVNVQALKNICQALVKEIIYM